MKKTLLTFLGLLLTGLGMLSLILMLVGGRFTYLRWLDAAGPKTGFLLKLLMTLAGFLLIFVSTINWKKEIQELQEDNRFDAN